LNGLDDAIDYSEPANWERINRCHGLLILISILCILLHLHSFPTRRSSDLRDRLAEAEEEEFREAFANAPKEITGRHPPSLPGFLDRKSTRLNSSHVKSSYAVFCLKKKTQQ